MKLHEFYVFGCNEYTKILVKNFSVIGIIDEFSTEESLLGIKRYSLEEISKKSLIISAVNSFRAFHALEKLKNNGYENSFFVGEVIKINPDHFSGTRLGDAYIYATKNKNLLLNKTSVFNDAISRLEYEKLVHFRSTLDLSFLSSFSIRDKSQYFEYFLTKLKFDNFFDGGSFDGNDSLRFTRLFPDYRMIYAIEPSQENSFLVKNQLSDIDQRMIIKKCCLGSHCSEVYLSGKGSATKITNEGTELVPQVTIDSFNFKGKTLIKLDIEGSEMEALKGAVNTINDPDNSFAISAYHLEDDFYNILELFIKSKVRRKLYFRHYTSGIDESVIFAV